VKSTSTPSTTSTTTTLTASIPDAEADIDPELFPDEDVEEETEEPEAPDPELYPDENDEEIISTEIDPNYFPEGDDGLDEALSSGVAEEFNKDDFIGTARGSYNPFTREYWEGVKGGWEVLREWYQGDWPFMGEDGYWNWKTVIGNPESGDVVEVKWLGADYQLGWNNGFKMQLYVADYSLPGNTGGVDGFTFGMGTAIEWKDKLKFSVGVPGGFSVTVVPRDIYNNVKNRIDSGIDFIRNPQKYF
jgi:hypothetical protein